jgi:hypothetical protein
LVAASRGRGQCSTGRSEIARADRALRGCERCSTGATRLGCRRHRHAKEEKAMQRPPFTIRQAAMSMLPHPPGNATPPSPTNADIMRALDEIKANQQALQHDINMIKKNITLLDWCCMYTVLKVDTDSAEVAHVLTLASQTPAL